MWFPVRKEHIRARFGLRVLKKCPKELRSACVDLERAHDKRGGICMRKAGATGKSVGMV